MMVQDNQKSIKLWRCRLLHDWLPWEQYLLECKAIGGLLLPGRIYEYTERRQRRVCRRCNYMQDVLIEK